MKKILATASLVLLLSSAASASNAALTCTRTGVNVESCCCVEVDGNEVCTLTGESELSCCCVSEG